MFPLDRALLLPCPPLVVRSILDVVLDQREQLGHPGPQHSLCRGPARGLDGVDPPHLCSNQSAQHPLLDQHPTTAPSPITPRRLLALNKLKRGINNNKPLTLNLSTLYLVVILVPPGRDLQLILQLGRKGDSWLPEFWSSWSELLWNYYGGKI